MLEVALMQIDNHFRSSGLVIAGYYQANELLGEVSPDFVAQKIFEKISEYFPSACLLMVNNRELSKQMKQPALYAMQLIDGKWKKKDKECIKLLPNNESVLQHLSNLIAEKSYKDVIDYDDHLDDLSQDWTNSSFKDIFESHSQ
nr:EOG090X0C9C [Cyclestheria hislopi]